MKKSSVVCVDAGGGHNCGLAIGLKKYRDVTTIWLNRNKHGLDSLVPDARYGWKHIPPVGDELIIVSCITYDKLKEYYRERHKHIRTLFSGYDRTVIIVTDGRFARNPNYYNKEFIGLDVYCNPCKIYWRGNLPVKEYYQPFDLENIDRTKNNVLTVAHSPFVKAKYREKGTNLITAAVHSLGLHYDLICNVSWAEALRRKAKAHIFIDQVDHYDFAKFNAPGYVWNALGKSGLEAMHLECLTITRGKHKVGQIPTPPIVWCDKHNLTDILKYYITRPAERSDIARAQRAWALEYSTYDFAAKNILNER